MKSPKLNQKTLSLIACLVAFVLSSLLRIVSYERLLGPNTSKYYRDFFALSVQILAFLIPTACCALFGAKRAGKTPFTFFRLRISPLSFLLCIAFGVLLHLLNVGATRAWAEFLSVVRYKSFGPTNMVGGDASAILLALVGSALLPALAEEGVARGLVFKASADKSKFSMIFLSALVFAMMHQSATKFGPTLLGGLWIAWLYWATDSMLAPVVAHFLNNALSVLTDALSWSAVIDPFLATPLGTGVLIGLAFLAVGGMLAIIRRLESRRVKPFPLGDDRDNVVVRRALWVAVLFIGIASTALSFVSGVLA